MPTWSNQLPPENKHMGFDLRRTPPAGALQAIITCEDMLVTDTHFFHGRTSPCERPNCPACNEGIPYRTHAYVAAFDPKKHEHFLFECTAHAAKPLAEYRVANNTLRGCSIYATRPKGLRNSKVAIQTCPVNLAKVNLPAPPDIIKALSIIWRLPTAAMRQQKDPWDPPELALDPARMRQMTDPPDNDTTPPTVAQILNIHTGSNGR